MGKPMENRMEIRKKRPNDDDFIFKIRGNTLKRCRERLSRIEETKFRATDLYLAVSTLSAGTALGALVSGLNTESSIWWLFYTIMPAVALATIVAYILVGYKYTAHGAEIAKDVLGDLPNPDDTTESYSEYGGLDGLWMLKATTENSGKASKGKVTITVWHEHITISGIILGESENRIGEIISRFANYNPSEKRIMFIYGYSAINDNGQIDNSECVFSGIVFGSSPDITIQGNWQHLTGPSVAGTAYFKKQIEK